MKFSIRAKLFALCILLVLLTTISSSVTYYVLIKQDKHRESQQRIEIAFDIILDDLAERRQAYLQNFTEFLQRDRSMALALMVYSRRRSEQVSLGNTLVSHLSELGYVSSSDRLMLYGPDKELIVTYLPEGAQEPGTTEWAEQTSPGVLAGEIPDTTTPTLFSEGTQIGIRLTAPLKNNGDIVGFLVGERVFTEEMLQRYAALSQTNINLFAGTRYSIGTLPVPAEAKSLSSEPLLACDELMHMPVSMPVVPVTLAEHNYYRGHCALMEGGSTIGGISVYLSQDIEKQAVWKIVRTILVIASIVTLVAILLTVVFSRGTLQSIQHIVNAIESASEGDLRPAMIAANNDEIGILARRLNQMIANLRGITRQVQGASHEVHGTADTIQQEMEHLVTQMELQSASVETTTESVETIKHFIETVAENTSNLLSAAAQILASIQETSASIEEVSTSIHSLTTNIQHISTSVDQLNQTGKQISGKTGELDEVAQQTATEIDHIDQSLKDVSHDADRAQELAKETLEAATSGQASVEAAIHGITILKDVVANNAHIIRDVNTWGERVGSILGIVDEITEQTGLLALNASIISAQAGAHGRGFAVVADEIKELATRTKNSTQEIGTLIHELRKHTETCVQQTEEGIARADQGVVLAYGVKDALQTIQERATRSSQRAENTARVIQQTADSSQTISASMNRVTGMVSEIRTNLQAQEQNIEMVFGAVENISGMAAQVDRASIEQKRTATEIGRSMGEVTEQFSTISEQTEALQRDSDQILHAMHMVKSTAKQILHDTTEISEDTVQHLLQQSEILQKIVRSFKLS